MSAIAPTKYNELASSILEAAPQHGFSSLREKGKVKLGATSFPTVKSEVWKYTRLSAILKKSFSIQEGNVSELPHEFKSVIGNNPVMVFVNGFFRPELSSKKRPQGLKIRHLGDISNGDFTEEFSHNWEGENEAFTHLNEATFTDGVFVEVDQQIAIEEPLFIVHLSSGTDVSTTVRNYIKVNIGSELNIINLFAGDDESSFTNIFNSIIVDENGSLNWMDFHPNGDNNAQINTSIVDQYRSSNTNFGSYVFGGKLIRKNIYVNVMGEGSETTANGSYVLNGKQVSDHRLILDHKAAHCNSNQTFKGVMGQKSTGIFNGKVYVRKDSQLINAFQSNQNILLTDDANAYSRPQLEIYADDVKCSHGSTIGQLDKEALFYLMARGIRRVEAEKLLVSAFTSEALENIKYESFKHLVLDSIADKTATL